MPMSKVRRQLDLVLLLSGLCNTTLIPTMLIIHTHMRITGRFKGYFMSVHGELISHRMKVVSSVVVRSQDFRDE